MNSKSKFILWRPLHYISLFIYYFLSWFPSLIEIIPLSVLHTTEKLKAIRKKSYKRSKQAPTTVNYRNRGKAEKDKKTTERQYINK